MKNKMFLLILLLLVPFVVRAKECDENCIKIESVEAISKSGNIIEKKEPVLNGRDINLDLKINNLNDSIKYKVVVKNESKEDYALGTKEMNKGNKYISINYSSNDDLVIEGGEEKELFIDVTYNNLIKSNEFKLGKYDFNDKVVLQLSNNNPINPETITGKLIIGSICLFIISVIVVIVLYTKRKKYGYLVIILSVAMIPIVKAMCISTIDVNVSVEVNQINYMPCTFDGDLVQGAEYEYEDFVYRYKQENKKTRISIYTFDYTLEWINMDEDGWGVRHKGATTAQDGTTVPKMCSSINGKPIVSMNYTFAGMKKLSKLDVSYIDTSNVVRMEGTFEDVGASSPEVNGVNGIEIRGLEYWDVSNVTTMEAMFESVGTSNNKVIITDMSGWDTSKVETFYCTFEFLGEGNDRLGTYDDFLVKGFEYWDFSSAKDISYMFSYFGVRANNNVMDLSRWNTSNIEEMIGTFEGFGRLSKVAKVIGLNNWDVSNVVNMVNLFLCFGTDAGEVSIGDISNWDVSNVKDMSFMFGQFADFSKVADISDLSKWNVSKVKDMSNMFDAFGFESEVVNIGDISNWDVSNVEDMEYMFRDFGTKANNITLDLSKWDFSKVTKVRNMFFGFASESTVPIDIGKIDIHSDNIAGLFTGAKSIKVVVNLYTSPNYGGISYNYDDRALHDAALIDGSKITINYSRNTTNIEDILATASPESHVVKGELLD